MVRVSGVHGFGFVKELIWCVQSGKCVFLVEMTLLNTLKDAEAVILDPSDCRPYHSQPSNASKVYAHADDHLHAAMELIAA